MAPSVLLWKGICRFLPCYILPKEYCPQAQCRGQPRADAGTRGQLGGGLQRQGQQAQHCQKAVRLVLLQMGL